MATKNLNLGIVPVSRGEFNSTTIYYKDNIVQYKRGSYQVVSESPITGISPTNDKNVVNPGWTLFAGTLDAQDVVNQIKEQEARSIQAVAAREAEILAKSNAAEVSSITNGLKGNDVQANLNDASNKLSELEKKIGKDTTSVSFSDNVEQGTDYKGYITGGAWKQLVVDVKDNQDFDLVVNTDCFSVCTIYVSKDGNQYISIGDYQTNKKTLLNLTYSIKAITLWAKAANVEKSGSFDFIVEINEKKSGIVYDIDNIKSSVNDIKTDIDVINNNIKRYDDILAEYRIVGIKDTLNANTEYKGYLDGKPKLIVDCPVNEDFYVRISSSVISDVNLKISYDGSNFYDYPEQSSFVPTNTDIPINIERQIRAFCIHVKSGHLATANGDYELSVKLTKTNSILNRVNSLETGKTDGDILHLNKEDEYLQMFENSKYSEEISGASGAGTKKCLTLCHFTDIHADAENLSRIKKFTDKYKDYIDDVICTGDMVRNDSSEDFSWWHENGGEGMLMTIGNHDTNVVSGGVSSWRGFGKVNTYNKYFKPYIANWGVTQPSNAESLGKCYYYKDYASYNIRIVALDCMYYDADEDTWFTNTLANAKSLGYGVIVLSHGLGKQGDKIQSTYTAINNTAGMVILDDGTYTYNANVHSRIDEFIGGGGNFICLLGGHFHMDMFGKVNSTTHEQLYLLGDCSARVPLRDHRYVNKTRMQDSFNIVSIDTNLKMIKVFKVGNQYDVFLRRKGTLCYNYETKKMIFNG